MNRNDEGEGDFPQRALSTWVISRSMAWVFALTLGPALILLPTALVIALTAPAWGAFAMIGMTLVLWLAIAAVMFEAHSKVTVGSDGVLIWRHFETHFVPFADIASVMEVDGVAIRMILHSGAVVDVYTAKEEQAMKPKYLRACESMLSRIRQGVERAQDQASVPTDGHEALRHAYRALRGGEPVRRVAYRAEPAPDPWQLLRIMENDGGAPAARAAAAVLARQHGDEEVRKRIRVAEQGTVNPKLKKLFRAAMSDAEPEVVEAALVEVEKGADGVSSQP